MEENTSEGRIREMSKEVVGCVKTVVGKNNFLFQLEYGHNKVMIYSSLLYLCKKEEVSQEADDTRYDLPEKYQRELQTIDGDPNVEDPCMFERVMYSYVFYCLCYVKEIATDMLEVNVPEERVWK